MIQIKPIFITVLLLFCQLSMAAYKFNPFQLIQAQHDLKTNVAPSTFKSHQAQGSFPYIIPDNVPAGVNIPIDLTGEFIGNITSLEIILDIEHTFAQDISATLYAPDGLAHLVLLSRIDSAADMDGLYTFSDQATKDIWEVGRTGLLPPDHYRTSTAGFVSSTGYYNNRHGGCTTRMSGAFGGLTPAQSNGIWTLNISDNQEGITGSIKNVYFSWSQSDDLIFDTSFETITSTPYAPLAAASDILGDCKKAQYDFTGTGFSDFVTSYKTNVDSLAIQMVSNEGDETTAEEFIFTGLPFTTTKITSGGDFDGDGIQDFVFEVPIDSNSYELLIRRSSRPNDLPVSFQITNPSQGLNFDLQIGDYDGDGLDDFAYFITQNINSEIAFLSIRESTTFSYRAIFTETGVTADFRPGGGFDHNGDKIADFALFIKSSEGGQIVKVFDGLNGTLLFDSIVERFNNGTFLVPGTFLANKIAGIGTLTSFNNLSHFWQNYDDVQDPNQLVSQGEVGFGSSNTDIPVSGDYDGDTIDDVGIWRPDTDGLGNRFIIRPSGSADPDNNLIVVYPDSADMNDRPLANIRIR